MRTRDCRSLLAVFLAPFLLPLGCQSGPGPAGAAPMGAAASVETVVIANEGVDLTSARLDLLQHDLDKLRKNASGKNQLPVADYVRAVRQAGEARRAADLGLRLAGSWSGSRTISLAPGEAVVVTAACFSAGPPSAAGPARDEAYRPAEPVDWIQALARRGATEQVRATVQGAIWNLLSGVPVAALPPDQQIIVRGALPDAADRFPGTQGASPLADVGAASDAMAARKSSEGSIPPEAIRVPGGVVLKLKHEAGVDRTNLSISVPPRTGETVAIDPTAYFFAPRRSDVTPLALAGIQGISIDRFTALRSSADSVMNALSGVTIENIPWSGTPEAFYELLTGTSLGEGTPLPRFDRAVQFGLLAIDKIKSGGKAVHALRDAAKEAGQDKADVDRMVRVAEGCYEFFLAIGKRPERLPIKHSYRFSAAVREIVAFLGPGARKGEDGRYVSADGAHGVAFDAKKSVLLVSRGDRKKLIRVE